jgi:hypothetical protein
MHLVARTGCWRSAASGWIFFGEYVRSRMHCGSAIFGLRFSAWTHGRHDVRSAPAVLRCFGEPARHHPKSSSLAFRQPRQSRCGTSSIVALRRWWKKPVSPRPPLCSRVTKSFTWRAAIRLAPFTLPSARVRVFRPMRHPSAGAAGRIARQGADEVSLAWPFRKAGRPHRHGPADPAQGA